MGRQSRFKCRDSGVKGHIPDPSLAERCYTHERRGRMRDKEGVGGGGLGQSTSQRETPGKWWSRCLEVVASSSRRHTSQVACKLDESNPGGQVSCKSARQAGPRSWHA